MRKSRRVSFALSAGVTAVFFIMVLVMAFRPQVMTGARGLLSSLGFILLTLVVMGVYSWWRIRKLDE
jgi:uncharacterized membrane protein (DUF485 family)